MIQIRGRVMLPSHHSTWIISPNVTPKDPSCQTDGTTAGFMTDNGSNQLASSKICRGRVNGIVGTTMIHDRYRSECWSDVLDVIFGLACCFFSWLLFLFMVLGFLASLVSSVHKDGGGGRFRHCANKTFMVSPSLVKRNERGCASHGLDGPAF